MLILVSSGSWWLTWVKQCHFYQPWQGMVTKPPIQMVIGEYWRMVYHYYSYDYCYYHSHWLLLLLSSTILKFYPHKTSLSVFLLWTIGWYKMLIPHTVIIYIWEFTKPCGEQLRREGVDVSSATDIWAVLKTRGWLMIGLGMILANTLGVIIQGRRIPINQAGFNE